MRFPQPRGELSSHAFATLRRDPWGRHQMRAVDATSEDDEQLTLFVLQELSFRPIEGVDPAWEEAPSFLAVRAALERRLEKRFRSRTVVPTAAADVAAALHGLIDGAEGPSLSSWMEAHGTAEHLREFAVHRAAYQLKEADPHSFAIPRLASGQAKSALLEIQLDEYGGRVPSESHAVLFAEAMDAVGLDPTAGPDVDRLPAVTLVTNTFLNMLGRSRRLVGACVGHLAVFEMTSVEPMARYASAVRRILDGDVATRAARFYDVHVAADGYHQVLACDELVTGLAEQHPELVPDVLFGAAALMDVEGALAQHLLGCWEQGRSSLLHPLPGSALVGADDLARAG